MNELDLTPRNFFCPARRDNPGQYQHFPMEWRDQPAGAATVVTTGIIDQPQRGAQNREVPPGMEHTALAAAHP